MNIQTILSKNMEQIRTTYHVKEIVVFGSYVKGGYTKSIDIDILVDFEEGHKDFFNYMRLKQNLEKLLGRKVDLIMKKAIKKRLQKQILAEVRYVWKETEPSSFS